MKRLDRRDSAREGSLDRPARYVSSPPSSLGQVVAVEEAAVSGLLDAVADLVAGQAELLGGVNELTAATGGRDLGEHGRHERVLAIGDAARRRGRCDTRIEALARNRCRSALIIQAVKRERATRRASLVTARRQIVAGAPFGGQAPPSGSSLIPHDRCGVNALRERVCRPPPGRNPTGDRGLGRDRQEFAQRGTRVRGGERPNRRRGCVDPAAEAEARAGCSVACHSGPQGVHRDHDRKS